MSERVAIVVGAGGELGRATAEKLAAARFTVVGVDRSEEAPRPGRRRPDRRPGRPEVLVNTIGTYHLGDALSATPEDLRLMIDVNVGPALWLTQAVVPYLRVSRSRSGHVSVDVRGVCGTVEAGGIRRSSPGEDQRTDLNRTEPAGLPGQGDAPRPAAGDTSLAVELRHLRYFVALAEAGSFTHVAEQIFIAQPTLSQQIRRLEQIVGAPLLQARSAWPNWPPWTCGTGRAASSRGSTTPGRRSCGPPTRGLRSPIRRCGIRCRWCCRSPRPRTGPPRC